MLFLGDSPVNQMSAISALGNSTPSRKGAQPQGQKILTPPGLGVLALNSAVRAKRGTGQIPTDRAAR